MKYLVFLFLISFTPFSYGEELSLCHIGEKLNSVYITELKESFKKFKETAEFFSNCDKNRALNINDYMASDQQVIEKVEEFEKGYDVSCVPFIGKIKMTSFFGAGRVTLDSICSGKDHRLFFLSIQAKYDEDWDGDKLYEFQLEENSASSKETSVDEFNSSKYIFY